MKRIAFLSYFLIMTSMGLRAHEHHPHEEPFATSTYDSSLDGAHVPYVVETSPVNYSASNYNMVQLSAFGNAELQDGSINPNDVGLILDQKGDYEINFQVVLVNEDSDNSGLPFTVQIQASNDDGTFFPEPKIGSVETLEFEELHTLDGFGYVKNIDDDTLITLQIANVGGPNPAPVTVLGWTISARKIDHRHGHDGEGK